MLLWLDPEQQFARLVEYLEPPLLARETRLRRYDPEAGMGQLVLKVVLLHVEASPGSSAVVYLPGFDRRDLGIDRDLKQYDFTVQAVNLNQAKEGAETAIAFFISMVSALLERPTDPTTVVAGEMSVRGMLQKVACLPERLELARDAGAKKILVPSENKRDLAEVRDEVLNRLQPVFYTDPINAAVRAMGLE